MNLIVATADGSHTIFVPELNEHYHSIHGAIQESEHIFIKAGYDNCKSDPIHIFEAGFGTGLNALLTAIRSLDDKKEVFYTAVDKYPVDSEIIESLNYEDFTGSEGKRIFDLIHSAPWGKMKRIYKNFNLCKIKEDLTNYIPQGHFDLVYFHAFGPDKQPEMWKREIFERISPVMKSGGILVTFSVKGEVKRNLRTAGFNVALIPGPPGKREMLKANKI